MKRWLCRLFGHDFPMPQPTVEDIERWIKDLPPRYGISARCRRCGVRRFWL